MALLPAPPEVTAALSQCRDELKAAAGDNLVSLILYGGLARGRFRPGRSDVNLALILRDAGPGALAKLAPILQSAWRHIRLEPFILTVEELPKAAEAFPTKFNDIRTHHLLLDGQDLLSSIHVSRRDLCRRVEQELRNLTLRLRRRFISACGDDAALRQTLSEIVVPLRIDLAAMLELAGEPLLTEDRSALVFEAAAKRFHLDAGPLARLSDLRTRDGASDNLSELYDAVMAAARQAADAAAAMACQS